jgi:ketosteroid isomerase-like protein
MFLFAGDMPTLKSYFYLSPAYSASTLTASDTKANADDESISNGVWQFVQQFNQAFATNDIDAYFSHVDPNVTVFTPLNPYRVEGIRNDREEFEYSLHSGATRVGLWQAMQPKVQLFENSAVVSFFVRGSIGPEGQVKTYYWKISDVLIKRGTGWKVVHIHVSATE